MVGEGVEGNPRGRMLDMFGGIRNFKENGSKRNRTRKDSGFFFFFPSKISCRLHGIHLTLTLNSAKDN